MVRKPMNYRTAGTSENHEIARIFMVIGPFFEPLEFSNGWVVEGSKHSDENETARTPNEPCGLRFWRKEKEEINPC